MTFWTILAFLGGVHMMILLLVAGYRFLDLWYCIREHWSRLTLRLVTLVLVDLAIYTLLPTDLAIAFINGQWLYLVFHVVIFWIARAGIRLFLQR